MVIDDSNDDDKRDDVDAIDISEYMIELVDDFWIVLTYLVIN